jgi:hypothetical protein
LATVILAAFVLFFDRVSGRGSVAPDVVIAKHSVDRKAGQPVRQPGHRKVRAVVQIASEQHGVAIHHGLHFRCITAGLVDVQIAENEHAHLMDPY